MSLKNLYVNECRQLLRLTIFLYEAIFFGKIINMRVVQKVQLLEIEIIASGFVKQYILKKLQIIICNSCNKNFNIKW